MVKPRTKRRRVSWKTVRILSQALVFLLFSGYFISLVYPLRTPWRPDLAFQLDPLTHWYLLLSGHGVPYWAFALLALALVFVLSRLFCGWACPLGTLLDLVSGIRGRLKLWNGSRIGPAIEGSGEAYAPQSADPGAANKLRGHRRESRPRQRSLLPAHFDVYLLLLLSVLALLGKPLLWLLDPIVFSFKFFTVGILPLLDAPLRAVFNVFDSRFYQQDWWLPLQDSYNHFFLTYREPIYTDTALFLGFATLVLGLEFYQRRFWCRYICPLGAVLRLSYKLHPLKRRINPDCAYCLKCEQACHFGGSREDDCVYCMECIDSCVPGRISFLPGGPNHPHAPLKPAPAQAGTVPSPYEYRGTAAYRARLTGELRPDGISRRLLLQYAAGGLVAYPAVRLMDTHPELPLYFIRPPGVADEARFVELCIKCGQCLKVCLTNGLQPALTEAGLSALWTPRLIPRMGECAFECNLCGQACPTGAIPNLPLLEKQRAVLGVAYLLKDRCIPYVTNENCAVCEEHCPVSDKAIVLRGGEHQKPVVLEQLCTGCGICERVCPVLGEAAIRVIRRPVGAAFEFAGGTSAGPTAATDSSGQGDYPAGTLDGAAALPAEEPSNGDGTASPGGDYPPGSF